MSVEYNPNKLGWGAAAVTVVGTLGLLFMAYSIHERTYRHPRDPMNVQVYHERDKAGAAAEHGAAPGSGGGGGGEHGTEKSGPQQGDHAPSAGGSTGAKPGGGH